MQTLFGTKLNGSFNFLYPLFFFSRLLFRFCRRCFSWKIARVDGTVYFIQAVNSVNSKQRGLQFCVSIFFSLVKKFECFYENLPLKAMKVLLHDNFVCSEWKTFFISSIPVTKNIIMEI